MNISRNKWWIFIFLIIAAAIVLTIVAAPSNNKLLAGSTFGKSPNGYGAWYEYMIEQGVMIERWQKPFSELKPHENKISFIKIVPPQIKLFHSLSEVEKKWIKQGNTMVVLGINATATAASFNTTQSYKNLDITIDTTLRKKSPENSILEDDYGAIVWQENMGKGKIIYAVTPYLAANAYQSNPDNYQFLAQLVNHNSLILVDEYLHGYKDKEVINKESQSKQNNILTYFSKTVWLPITIQIIILIVIAIASKFPRFGQPKIIKRIQIDNSQAYIQALAGVLEKAECSNFVVKTITKDEKSQLQHSLGLRKGNISDDILLNEWAQATGKDSRQLGKLLKFAHSDSRLNYAQLVKWVQTWQQFR
ncbi:MAG: DUF4350 domain-containing protein [Xenococcaceae cyanobacterium MO_188.B19]|nr:DUF4350 domain-containing protein [Xenococcaceae cyanobacterium MO_188.B19]